jgi:tetraacyldisaccharide 4'-kinase
MPAGTNPPHKSPTRLPGAAAYRRLVSGAAGGPVAALLRSVLYLFSQCYRLAVYVRSLAYRWRMLRPRQAGVPVISIGNLTAGGTGKTPLVAWLAEKCNSRGVKVCLLSRGYKAAPGAANDEALVLAQLCPEAPHLQGADRAALARRAVDELHAEALILDDGFQHRRLHRDLDIVLVDATNPWGYGHLLPRGLLREPPAALQRAQAVVITRVDQAPPEAVRSIRETVAAENPQALVAEAVFVPQRLVNSAGRACAIEQYRGRTLCAFSGIGNPEAFGRTLAQLELAVEAYRVFPDHHPYETADLAWLQREAELRRAAAIVTTQKDLVKIGKTELGAIPLWAVQIAPRFVAGELELEASLARVLKL